LRPEKQHGLIRHCRRDRNHPEKATNIPVNRSSRRNDLLSLVLTMMLSPDTYWPAAGYRNRPRPIRRLKKDASSAESDNIAFRQQLRATYFDKQLCSLIFTQRYIDHRAILGASGRITAISEKCCACGSSPTSSARLRFLIFKYGPSLRCFLLDPLLQTHLYNQANPNSIAESKRCCVLHA
jgi:hypothetical protein